MKKRIKLLIIFLYVFTFTNTYSQTEIIFDEQFDNNNAGWSESATTEKSAQVSSGKYKLKYTPEGLVMYWRSVYVNPNKDFYIESKVKQTDDGKGSAGILWGGSDSDNFYYFVISEGYFKVAKYEKDVNSVILKWEKSTEINANENVLGIQKQGKNMIFYVNSKEVGKAPFEKLFGINYGFIVSGPIEYEADYLQIKQDDNKLVIIDNPINGYVKENLGKNVNSEFDERAPKISPDGKTLYFVQEYNEKNTGGKDRTDIYYSTMDETGNWLPAKNAGKPMNNTGNNSVVAVSSDGNSILLMNKYSPDGSPNGGGISETYRTSTGWTMPVDIDIEDYYNDGDYSGFFLSADRNILLMAIIRKDTYGGEDIYVSFKEGNKYSKPINIGTDVNSPFDDFTPFLASDNKTMYFATYGRRGYGSADIFVTKRLDETWTKWSEPQNLGPEINTEDWDAYFSVPASGAVAYLVSGKESYGYLDIYRMKVPQAAKIEPVVLIKGQVLDKKNGKPVATEIVYNDLETGKKISTANSDPNNGKYSIVLPYGKKYEFLAAKEGYYSISENIDVTGITEYKEIEKDLYLQPIEQGAVIRLNNIFFDTGKYELKKESFPELERLTELMTKNPKIKIEIQGHTDNVGNDEYNKKLSSDRANSVKNYLINQKKIAPKRVISAGYGETMPVSTNDSDEGKALNRRVEFKVIEN